MRARNLRTGVLFAGILFLFSFLQGQPSGYYQSAYGKSGYTLKTALYQIIKDHTVVSYDGLWTAFEETDAREDGKVWDMYSNTNFTFGNNQCGNYGKEGDCYNREHSFPKSWFSDAKPMYSDLFHLYPTDGYVNNKRGNNPFGEVSNPTYTSTNGSKVGKNTTSGYSGTVFEPADEYKGDFARSYFYMATRYEDKIASWSDCDVCAGNNQASFKQWTVDLLLKWHLQDPVSQKEIDRNEAVYGLQHNRNPFIDYPELVEKIWGNDNTAFQPENVEPEPEPEPETEYVIRYEYHDAQGNLVAGSQYVLGVEIPEGKNIAKAAKNTVLIDEDFPGVIDADVNGKDATIANTGATYVESFATAYTYGNSAVRMASSNNAGSIVFKEISVSGEFEVSIKGKGWADTEKEFTVSCTSCTPASQTVKFSKSKADLSGFSEYETLDPIKFTANGKTKLTFSSAKSKRVIIDRVTVTAGSDSGEGGGNGDNGDDDGDDDGDENEPDNPNTPDNPGETTAELIISEYVEGSGNNKAIELYNGTGNDIDLSAYKLVKEVNGNSSSTKEVQLTGTLKSGATYIVAHGSAVLGITANKTDNSTMDFNGNDAVKLYKGNTKIDVVGVEGSPADWGKDVTLRRKCGKGPNPTWDASEWETFPMDDFSGLGKHCEGVTPDNPDNPDNPDPDDPDPDDPEEPITGEYGLQVLYPTAGQTLNSASVAARVALVDKADKEIATYTLKEVKLPQAGNYTFLVNLWKEEEKLNEKSVDFVYDNPNP
ncbi:MAG: endonuclease, partial [Lentimicrobiaceae bacterium]|nr:endonuclease [Lentimicrobiaceae bacterium]